MSELGEIIALHWRQRRRARGQRLSSRMRRSSADAVGKLVEVSALEKGAKQGWARYLIRSAALQMGIIPSSIHELYMARGRGEVPHTFTVPAMNLRVLSFDAARAVFRVAQRMNAGAFHLRDRQIGDRLHRPTTG